MDSVTHIVVGACIGEVFAGKKLGKKAMLWGAAAQTLPDIDVVTSWWMNVPDGLLAHRGFTHSVLFAVLASALLSYLAGRWHKPHNITFGKWMAFFLLEIGTHMFLDTLTAYGTGLMEPFSHARYSLNTIFVADPFFTIVPLIVSIILLIIGKKNKTRMAWGKFGIIVCALYLGYCTYNKMQIERDTKEIMAANNIQYTKHFTTPTPLNNWLWYVVADDGKGFHVGYRSVFDSKKEIDWVYAPKKDSLLIGVYDKEELNKLIRFSDGYYTADMWGDTLLLNDLRFGQQGGWVDKHAKFVFFYYLQGKASNDLIVQRGRFSKVDGSVFTDLYNRIKGN